MCLPLTKRVLGMFGLDFCLSPITVNSPYLLTVSFNQKANGETLNLADTAHSTIFTELAKFVDDNGLIVDKDLLCHDDDDRGDHGDDDEHYQ